MRVGSWRNTRRSRSSRDAALPVGSVAGIIGAPAVHRLLYGQRVSVILVFSVFREGRATASDNTQTSQTDSIRSEFFRPKPLCADVSGYIKTTVLKLAFTASIVPTAT